MVAAIDWSKWSAIGTLVAAFATLGLACVTLWLVVVTKRMVGAGRDELTATKDLAAQTRRQALIAATALSVQLERDRREGVIEPKSRGGRRSVPIAAALRSHLAARKLRRGNGAELFFGNGSQRLNATAS